jgi:hypothetical protein
MKEEIKTVKDIELKGFEYKDGAVTLILQDCISLKVLKAEAVNEINNLDELEYILGLMSEPEKRILIKYIKWKNNLTEEDLKEKEEKAAQNDFRTASEKKKDNQVIILDDNELSIMQYAKEFPDNWKKICKSLEKDNHNQVGQDVGAINQAPMGNDNSLNPTAIQQSKVFEDIFGLIDEWAIEHKTSWKYLKRKGFQNAEEFGDVIILDINNHLDGIYPTAIENLKSKIKEKWGKIER